MDAACWCAHTKVFVSGIRLGQLDGSFLVEVVDPLHPLLGPHVSGEGWRDQPGCLLPGRKDSVEHHTVHWIEFPLSGIMEWTMGYGNLYLCTALVLTTVWEDNEFCWYIQWKPLKVCKATDLISEYWMTCCLLLQFKATSVDLTCHIQLATIHSPMQVCDAWALTNRVGADSLSFSALYCSAASWQIVSCGLQHHKG